MSLGPSDVRIMQDGVRDTSVGFGFRADESGGWVWQASNVLEDAVLDQRGQLAGVRVLELGSGSASPRFDRRVALPPTSVPCLAYPAQTKVDTISLESRLGSRSSRPALGRSGRGGDSYRPRGRVGSHNAQRAAQSGALRQ